MDVMVKDLMVVSDSGWIVTCTLITVERGGFVGKLDILDTSGELDILG